MSAAVSSAGPKDPKPRSSEPSLRAKPSPYQVLSEEQIAEIRKAFHACDSDGSGVIEQNELSSVMRELGEHPSDEELRDLLKDLDADGDGTISWDEFLQAMSEWIAEAAVDDDDDDEEDDTLDRDPYFEEYDEETEQ